jgi:hypothetical protein
MSLAAYYMQLEPAALLVPGSLYWGDLESRKRVHFADYPVTVPNETPLTIQFWVYATAGVRAHAFGFKDLGVNADRLHCEINVDNNIYFDFGKDYTNGRVVANFTPHYGKWTQVTVTATGTVNGTNKIYLNSTLAATKTNSKTLNRAWTDLTLGYGVFGTTHRSSSKCYFSTVRIFVGLAMEQAEVTSTWDKLLPATYPGLTAQWPLFSGGVANADKVPETKGAHEGSLVILTGYGGDEPFSYSTIAPPITTY